MNKKMVAAELLKVAKTLTSKNGMLDVRVVTYVNQVLLQFNQDVTFISLSIPEIDRMMKNFEQTVKQRVGDITKLKTSFTETRLGVAGAGANIHNTATVFAKTDKQKRELVASLLANKRFFGEVVLDDAAKKTHKEKEVMWVLTWSTGNEQPKTLKKIRLPEAVSEDVLLKHVEQVLPAQYNIDDYDVEYDEDGGLVLNGYDDVAGTFHFHFED